MLKKIEQSINSSIQTKLEILKNKNIVLEIEKIVKEISNRLLIGKKLVVAGNGGSAADAQHLVAELVSRFYLERKGLKAVALTTDSSIITAIGNDYGYEKIFSRQIDAICDNGDIFIAISTSGNSKNILEAIVQAKKQNLFVIGLTGENGGKMANLCDIIIKVPSKDTPRIQESHIMIEHIICELIELELFGNA